jgi:aspartyl-tRNA(Asn)/glutamyl-tRNA(Gln) amidotransferase subunit C
MKLSTDDVSHLAQLSRLDLSAEEIERMTHEFASILGYVDRIQQVDVTDVEPFAMPDRKDGWRPDVADEVDDVTRELILSSFPERAGDLLAAPGVFQTPKK